MSLGPGTRLGRYEVESLIGSGGMGEVYRATDTELGRAVAIKVLPEKISSRAATRARFEREARAVASLSHPNVLTIHDFGQTEGLTYAVTELLEGKNLGERLRRGPLSWSQAVSIARSVAEGLAAAHEKGIVHRDIKPANIFLTGTGQVKVLDFGVARWQQPPTGESQVDDGLRTATDVVLGTAGYMSPEQARGKKVDERSDIFSLGCVLYEMLTGKKPFQRPNPVATALAIVHDEPPKLSEQTDEPIPNDVEEVTLACLRKHPADRWQSAEILAAALDKLVPTEESRTQTRLDLPPTRARLRRRRWRLIAAFVLAVLGTFTISRFTGILGSGANEGTQVSSLAVLPLLDVSGTDEPYFADGMTEALIAELARIQALRVISRTSVVRYRDTELTLPEIADELSVQMILEGSVTRSGERVRVILELVEAASDRHLLSRTFEGETSNILTMQRSIARAVADEIRIKLTPRELKRLEGTPRVNAEAHDAYLRGRFELNKRTLDGARQAIDHFNHAVLRDPQEALAYVGLAEAYILLPKFDALAPDEGFDRAQVAAVRALNLDPELAEAHAALGMIRTERDWDFTAAEHDYRRAIEFNPSHPGAHERYALLLAARGQVDDAILHARRAVEIDPMSPHLQTVLASVFYFSGRFEEAVNYSHEALARNPDYGVARAMLGMCFEQMGRPEDAVTELMRATELFGIEPYDLPALGHAYVLVGKDEEAQGVLDHHASNQEKQAALALAQALVMAARRDDEKTLEWLEQAHEDRTSWLMYLAVDPRFKHLRDEPRFKALLSRIGLPEPQTDPTTPAS